MLPYPIGRNPRLVRGHSFTAYDSIAVEYVSQSRRDSKSLSITPVSFVDVANNRHIPAKTASFCLSVTPPMYQTLPYSRPQTVDEIAV